MVAPYNYAIQTPSAFESLVSGLKLGTSLQEMQAQQQLKEAQTLQIQQKLAEEKRRRERMAELNNIAPNELSSRLGEFSDVLPHEMFNALRNYAATADETTLRNKAGQLGQMIMAAGSNDPDVLESVGQELMSAAPDEPSKKAISTYLASAKRNPKQFVLGQLIVLRQLGDVGVKIADSIGEQLSLKPGAKDVLRQQAASADEAVAKAESAKAAARTAEEKAAADLRLARAEAQKAEIQARVQAAEEKAAGGIELTPELRTAIGATKLPPEQKQALLDLAAAKAPKTTVSLPDQQKAEDVAFGKSLVARFDKIREQADLATSQIANLDVAQRILDNGFKTGFGTEWQAAAASVLSSLGVKDAEKFATNAQVFLAQSRNALLTKQLEQKGPQTENDAKRIDQTFVSLGNTREANKFLLAHARAMALRNREIVAFWQKYKKENGTFDGAQEAYDEGPGAKSIFDYAPLKPFANIVSQRATESAPTPVITPPAAQTAPATPAAAPARRSIDDVVNQYRSR